jgi:RNA polymerase sigma factor (sigma-70 family)
VAEGQTDAEVIAASLAHPRAFTPIFERHYDAIHGYLARRAGTTVADDLASEVLERAFTLRHRFDQERASARPWLYGIAANVLRSHHRSAGRGHRAVARAGAALVHPAGPAELAVTRVDAAHEVAALVDRVAALPGGEREALLLLAWEDLTYAEIADAQGVPIGTVRSRLNRARRRLCEPVDLAEPTPGDHDHDGSPP